MYGKIKNVPTHQTVAIMLGIISPKSIIGQIIESSPKISSGKPTPNGFINIFKFGKSTNFLWAIFQFAM
jgi:hypothetical protein